MLANSENWKCRIGAAFMAAGADQPFDISFHQDLQHGFRHGSQEIAVTALLQQLDQRHSVIELKVEHLRR